MQQILHQQFISTHCYVICIVGAEVELVRTEVSPTVNHKGSIPESAHLSSMEIVDINIGLSVKCYFLVIVVDINMEIVITFTPY